jgi:tetratricopeptide (TPR) repeat protein
MKILQLSSGDLVADRRTGYAAALAEDKDFAAAAELMEQALELVPGWAAGWCLLGDYRNEAGNAAGAIAAYRWARRLRRSAPMCPMWRRCSTTMRLGSRRRWSMAWAMWRRRGWAN